jgi:hypothetical protein
MSAVTSIPARRRGLAGEHRHRFAHQSAQARRERAQTRERDQDRIIALLHRGCGITQILSEIGHPGDRLTTQVARALQVRRILDAIGQGAPAARAVKIAPRDMERTIAFLDERIIDLENAVAAQRRRRKSRLRRDQTAAHHRSRR